MLQLVAGVLLLGWIEGGYNAHANEGMLMAASSWLSMGELHARRKDS